MTLVLAVLDSAFPRLIVSVKAQEFSAPPEKEEDKEAEPEKHQ